MRTTITISDDLMTELKKRSYKTGQSLKDVVNSTLRAGLNVSGRTKKSYTCPSFPLGASPRYNLDRSLNLAESLENEEIVRKIQLKK